MEAAPVGKLFVRDPESGEVSLVDADPVTVDSSVEFSGLSDVSDPSDPLVYVPEGSADVEVDEPAVAPVEELAVEEPVEEPVEEAVEEAVNEVPVFEPDPAPVKRGRPKKASQ